MDEEDILPGERGMRRREACFGRRRGACEPYGGPSLWAAKGKSGGSRNLGAGSWLGGRGLRLPGGLGTSRLAGGAGCQTDLLCNIGRHSLVYYANAKSDILIVDDFKRSPSALLL